MKSLLPCSAAYTAVRRQSPVNMASRGLQLLLVSLLFHVVYLNSIFSVYFRSQVVDVPERFKVETEDGERLAKRVVLIVGALYAASTRGRSACERCETSGPSFTPHGPALDYVQRA
jgi:hypothetical protein